MRNKEMTMSKKRRIWAMYVEACTEENVTMTPEGFMKFVAWRKNVEKYFENSSDSS